MFNRTLVQPPPLAAKSVWCLYLFIPTHTAFDPQTSWSISLVHSFFDGRAINKVLIRSYIGCKFFSDLDLYWSYHQFQMYEPYRHTTAFKWDGEQLMFIGSPFGLIPLSHVASRTMSILFSNKPFVSTFIDNIGIYSKTFEEHTTHGNTA